MHLTKIELHGFKSFPDRTVFEFDSGITAILGPNGCGKSNVVDAIKWVLGESNARNLRGEQMTDVIFAGSEGRKPLGMAEVSLYFNNEDGALPIEYREVCLTRRLYRSGESEYLINGTPCLRRQIRELFLDTGIGRSAYSFIEQGKVEEIINAKPDERRAIFEEAAGVAKYKMRRKETLARLERTQQNLLRVNDIISEVDRGIRRLARQAAGARRYQKLKAELDALRRHLYSRQYAALAESYRRLTAEREQIEALYAEEAGRQAQRAQRLADLTQSEVALLAEADNCANEANALQEKIGAIATAIADAAARAEALQKSAADTRAQMADSAQRLQHQREEEKRLAEVESDLRQRLAAEEAALQDVEAKLGSLRDTNAQAEQEIEEARRRQQDAAEAKRRAAAALLQLESEIKTQEQRLAELAVRAQELAAAEAKIAASLSQAEAEWGKLRDEVTSALQAQAQSHSAAEQARQECLRLAKRAAELAATRSRHEGRLATLRDLEASWEGIHAGPRRLLLAKRQGEEAGAELQGMVADLIAVSADLALAIETALGGMAQALVVATAAGAQRGVELLKRERAGRATFLPLDLIRPRPRLAPHLLALPGVRGEAVDLVRFDETIRPAMEYLLAGVLVVDNLARARELAAAEARGIKIVTPDGEIIHPSGAITGGWSRETGVGLIQRKAEIQEIETALQALAAEAAQLETQQAEARRREEEALAACRRHEATAQTLQTQLVEAEKALAIARREAERNTGERCALRSEQEEREGRLRAVAAQRLTLQGDSAACEAAEAETAERLAALTAKQQDLRQAMTALQIEVTKWREQRAATLSRLEMAAAQRQSIASEIAAWQAEQARQTAALAAAEQEAQQIAQQRQALEEEEASLLRQRDERRAAATEARQRLAAVRQRLQEERDEEHASQRRLQEIMSAQNDLRLRENECRLRMENLAQKAREEIQVEDLAAAADTLPPAVADAAAAGEPPDDLSPLLADNGAGLFALSEEDIGRWIEGHLAKIARLGPIDPQAMDDLAELEARKAFLESERDDLEKAAQDLREVIERLNRECSRQFDETFQTVRQHFAEMFRLLFGGGKADLVLEPADDPLERGVEIVARPPGKEAAALSLLSGGEKALATVALLFALLRSKPTPFCVLDEVDGPLDESNIDRFMTVLRQFSRQTQFILISHSKRTMGMTDTIYGVTQDEPGVSRKYSLRFRAAYGEEASPARRAATPEEVMAG
ncbi:MAG: chromosome segregation protein SMC [Planctomycetota bacterium]|nr:chromosome segregation protein SMC [Planctomycetota bacterium]